MSRSDNSLTEGIIHIRASYLATNTYSVGASWPADSRKGKLIRYVTEMCVKGCRMSATLDVCEIAPGGDGITL